MKLRKLCAARSEFTQIMGLDVRGTAEPDILPAEIVSHYMDKVWLAFRNCSGRWGCPPARRKRWRLRQCT